LGLTIAKSIAEGHGGRLTLRNLNGRGLEARLVLPRSTTMSKNPQASSADIVS
jgi:signal transduction histidine kinase